MRLQGAWCLGRRCSDEAAAADGRGRRRAPPLRLALLRRPGRPVPDRTLQRSAQQHSRRAGADLAPLRAHHGKMCIFLLDYEGQSWWHATTWRTACVPATGPCASLLQDGIAGCGASCAGSPSQGQCTDDGLVCGARRGPAPGVARDAAWDVAREAVEGEFIVRFREYRMAAEHRAALEASLGAGGSPGGLRWQWVERRNSAAAHPTDFGLLRVDLADAQALKARPLWVTCAPARNKACVRLGPAAAGLLSCGLLRAGAAPKTQDCMAASPCDWPVPADPTGGRL